MKNYVYTEKEIMDLVLADARMREDVAEQPAVGSLLVLDSTTGLNVIQILIFSGSQEEVTEQIGHVRARASVTRPLR